MGRGHTRISHRLNRTTIATAMKKASTPQSLSTMLRPIMTTAVPIAANLSGLIAAKRPRMILRSSMHGEVTAAADCRKAAAA
jgi:hypothetical protein